MSGTEFRRRIRAAIGNPQLQAALDANAQRRGKGRVAAFNSLPNWPERRRQARAVRADAIERLHELAAAFEAAATRNGLRVHRAADAAQALRLVTDIAERSTPAAMASKPKPELLFAKSKSMVSEEIELNKALEARGHRVVETDLGEYIVQLRGEKPAHIITPAVHLMRDQIGELFAEKIGLPYTTDIPTLTAAARSKLREVFLTADVGVSGVNFGIAGTGGICIVTNEGNGRMVTTMPRVHIALMGLERMVPTLNDLALMLSLLPRSATGQKLSVYTQLIHSPRREGEVDGALERHVIMVDNGRSRLWDSDLRESLYCIRCGACLNACPVFRELGGHAYVGSDGEAAPYPGPIGSVISPGLAGLAQFGHLAQASTLCGACKDACPVEIDLPKMLTRVRAGSPKTAGLKAGIGLGSATRFGLQVFSRIAVAPGLFGAMQKLGAVGARLVSPRAEWMRLPAMTGWGMSKDLIRPASRSFRERWRAGLKLEPLNQQPTRSSAVAGQELKEADETEKGELVGRLITEMQALGAQVHQVAPGALPKLIDKLLQGRGIDEAAAWQNIEGLGTEARDSMNIKLVAGPDALTKAGITGCTCAIAETGTLLLTSAAGQPLTDSLLPDVHVAIVTRSQIVWSLEEAFRMRDVRESASTVLISGPSRTADIEMTLTIGVHGPKELLVCIVD